MRHPNEKFIKIELVSLTLAVIIGLFAIIQAAFIWFSLSVYLIAISLFCDGVIALSTHQQVWAMKQLIRSILLFLLTTLLIFKL